MTAQIWFWVVGFLFIVFAALDGIDTGIGIWFPFVSTEIRQEIIREYRRHWFANKIWLIAAAGALCLGFPAVCTINFRGPMTIIELALIGYAARTVAIYLLPHATGKILTVPLGAVFTLGSILPPFLFGLTVGNIVKGVPLDVEQLYAGSIGGLFSHFSIVSAIAGVFMYSSQATHYLSWRAKGGLREHAVEWAWYSWIILFIAFLDLTVWSVSISPYISRNFMVRPWLFLMPLTFLGCMIVLPLAMKKGWDTVGFFLAEVSSILIVLMFGESIFPFVVPVFFLDGVSISVRESAASPERIEMLGVIALITVPLLALTTVLIYRSGTGKRKLELSVE